MTTKTQFGVQLGASAETVLPPTHRRWSAIAACAYFLLLVFTINNHSLWTDEAFSAYLASHDHFSDLVSTLVRGDSSDLQAAGYYVYVYLWCHLFGYSEAALRAANLPFVALFIVALLWTSRRVFRTEWGWACVAFFPFLWYYASEARAYFAIASLSMVSFGALFAYFEEEIPSKRRSLAWVVAGSLLLGTSVHMLMLLAVFPMLVILVLNDRLLHRPVMVSDWAPALRGVGLPFLLCIAYLLWTFLRGVAYEYPRPTLASMLSVPYALCGLASFGPNRSYSVDLRPYWPLLISAWLTFTIALATTISTAYLKKQSRPYLMVICSAVAGAGLELLVLSLYTQQQFQLRHIASLIPLVIIGLLAAFAPGEANGRRVRLQSASAVVLAVLWVSADARMLFLPQYQKEDHHSAVHDAIALREHGGADIAFVADPFAGAYYGLNFVGPERCAPLPDSCIEALKKVSWVKRAPAEFALRWQPQKIEAWLQDHSRKGIPAVVVLNESRQFAEWASVWRPVLSRQQPTSQSSVHGFSIFLFTAK